MRFIVILVFVVASVVRAAELPHRFDDVLVIGGIGRAARSPIRFDAVESSLVQGTFAAPKEGDALTAPDGNVRLRQPAKSSGENATIEHESLSGGYAFAVFESDRDRVAMLDVAGASMVYVNGEPRVGDPYGYGFVRLPVGLRKGRNDFLFACGRGRLTATLAEAPSDRPCFLGADDTLPDLVADEPIDVNLGIVIVNPTPTFARGLAIELRHPDGSVSRTDVKEVLPFSIRKANATLRGAAISAPGNITIDASLLGVTAGDVTSLASRSIDLKVVTPREPRKVTFTSAIDGSAQYYAVVPNSGTADAPPGLVLSLHGASVEATSQARAYAPKDFAIIVCPTNRRPFGFDWEDWGRLDALEVLDHAVHRFHTDPRRQWLTGHSMGGHGTWQLGAHFPDRFAAIAPSAGWISFRTYGGGPELREDGVEGIFRRAMSPSETLALGRNFRGVGVYVLHGDVDDNVPVGQARAMRRYLAAEDGGSHPDFTYYERPGANHWWGNECVDWPPLMRFLAERTLADAPTADRIDFVTASPSVSSKSRWITIDQQREAMRPSSVSLTRTAEGYAGTTDNVARLGIREISRGAGPVAISLDGVAMQVARPDPASTLWLARDGDAWRVELNRSGKFDERSGPFKDAFRRDMLFVVGTMGDDDADARLLAKARFDAETWWYRGNGAVDIVLDTEFDADAQPERNVILFGNADTNRAWAALLADCPISVRTGAIRVGEREFAGDGLACLFAYPRSGSERATVGVVAGTGASGDRLTWRLPYFVSGVGYPDLTVLEATTLMKGANGVRLVGFFGNDWSVEAGSWSE